MQPCGLLPDQGAMTQSLTPKAIRSLFASSARTPPALEWHAPIESMYFLEAMPSDSGPASSSESTQSKAGSRWGGKKDANNQP